MAGSHEAPSRDRLTRHWPWLLVGAVIVTLALNFVWPIPGLAAEVVGIAPPEARPMAPGDLPAYVSSLSERGRLNYQLLQVVDFGLIALYAVGLVGGILRIATAAWRWLALLPLVAAAADVTENAVITWVLLSHPAEPEAAAAIFGIATTVKWIGLVASVAGLVLLGAISWIRRRRGPVASDHTA